MAGKKKLPPFPPCIYLREIVLAGIVMELEQINFECILTKANKTAVI